MPAIQGVWVGPNPITGVDGLWIWLSNSKGLVGIARTNFPAPSGTETPASYSAKLTSLAQGWCNTTTRLAANDPLLTNPEPG
jgi:hypothetical protein